MQLHVAQGAQRTSTSAQTACAIEGVRRLHINMRRPFVVTISLLAMFTSCGSIPTPERLEAAQIGPALGKDEAVRLATEALQIQVPTIATAKVAFAELSPGFYKVGGGNAGHRHAWELVAWVEAENSVGFREPAARHHFYFLGSKLVATAQPGSVWTGRGYESRYQITEFEGGGMDQVDARLRNKREVPLR